MRPFHQLDWDGISFLCSSDVCPLTSTAFLAGLVQLSIGAANPVGDGGVDALAAHCAQLRALTLGDNAAVGEAGAVAIGAHCRLLTALALGANSVGDYGLASIATGCTCLGGRPGGLVQAAGGCRIRGVTWCDLL